MPRDSASATAALEIEGLAFAFGKRQVLRDIALRVAPGELCVLLGPNGAGKTTLFALATRLYAARQGRIAVFGHDLATEPREALAQLGVVFQQPTLDLDLTLAQNLAYHAALHGVAPRDAAPDIEAALRRAGLADRKRERARALSGGQRRRLELARALLHRPALLLLDEPTVGLDIDSRATLLADVQALCRERGVGVLWATHLIDEAEAAARIIVLHEGRIRADSTPQQIAAPAGSLAAAFAQLTRRAAA